jgi:AraC-like DNA-binding protein
LSDPSFFQADNSGHAPSLPASGVLVIEAVREAPGPGSVQEWDFHAVAYQLHGTSRLYRSLPDGTTAVTQLEPGALISLPADSSHRVETLSIATLHFLCLSRGFVDQNPEAAPVWARLNTIANGRALSSVFRGTIERKFRRMLAEQSSPGVHVGKSLMMQALAYEFVVHLSRIPGDSIADDSYDRVRRTMNAMTEFPTEEWTLDRAAGNAGLSIRRFSQLIRELSGKSFTQKLNELRVARAMNLLLAGEKSVMDVAFASGFNDLAHFHRVFRRIAGSSPKQWLREARIGPAPPSR